MTTGGGVSCAALIALALGVLSAGCGGGSSGGGGAAPPANATLPQLSAVSPAQGPAGTRVTITGSGFAASAQGNAVFFGTTQATTIVSASATAIECEVPAGAPAGTVNLTVSTAAGASNALPFSVSAQVGGPTITSLSPSAGPVGTTVTITGSGFDPNPAANTVTFNGTATTVGAASPTQLTVPVPSGATSGAVVVTLAGGSSNGAAFTVTQSAGGGQGASGSRALDYLSAVPFTNLLVEVDSVQGATPDAAALDRLRARIAERCNKPGGVTLLLDDTVASPGFSNWSLAQIQAFEQQHRDHYPSGNTAVLYVLYLDNGSEGDSGSSRVLGLSYSGTSFCVFKDSVQSASTLTISGPVIERAVLVHELGHNLGLVNNGVAMQTPHQDAANGAHDVNTGCVMHFSIETSLVSQLLGTVPDTFDAACIADLQAAGGK